MKMPNFIYGWIGKFIGSKLKLEGDSMDETKKWYVSKGVWTAIVTGLMGIYVTIQSAAGLPAVPEWIFAILGGLGLYSRVVADKKIG